GLLREKTVRRDGGSGGVQSRCRIPRQPEQGRRLLLRSDPGRARRWSGQESLEAWGRSKFPDGNVRRRGGSRVEITVRAKQSLRGWYRVRERPLRALSVQSRVPRAGHAASASVGGL